MYHLVQHPPPHHHVNSRKCSLCKQEVSAAHKIEEAQGVSFPTGKVIGQSHIFLPFRGLSGLCSSDHRIIFQEAWKVWCHQQPWDTVSNNWWAQVNGNSSHDTLQISTSVWVFDLEPHHVWSYTFAVGFGVYIFLISNVYSSSLLLRPNKGLTITPTSMREPGLSLGHSWSSNLEARWMGQVSTTWRQGPAPSDLALY